MTAIETPCVKICVLDPVSAVCIGCGRTVAEIAAWSDMPADERRRIMAMLAERLRTRSPPAGTER